MARAGELAVGWRTMGLNRLVIGLQGDLGSGKSSWVRGMLAGLGYSGRVPSPTFSLLEPYNLDGLTVMHLDLYRLEDAVELETLGLRDWLGQPDTWLVLEWPERWPAFAQLGDVLIQLAIEGQGRRVDIAVLSSIAV